MASGDSRPDPHWKRFVSGGTACMIAGTSTNPIDVIKVRLQLQGELSSGPARAGPYKGFLRGSWYIAQREGIRGLFKGVAASAMREASYSTIRMGGYEMIKEMMTQGDERLPLWKRLLAGLTSGGIGAALATPTDLVKIRFQSHASGPPPYPSTLGSFGHIYRNEGGLRGLYRGVGPNSQRAAALTAVQLSSYDTVKHAIASTGVVGEGMSLHFASSMVTGLITVGITSPLDVAKTRMMTNSVYTSTWDAFVRTAKSEGIGGLYKGFVPNFARVGPHTIITFLMLEQLRLVMGMDPLR